MAGRAGTRRKAAADKPSPASDNMDSDGSLTDMSDDEPTAGQDSEQEQQETENDQDEQQETESESESESDQDMDVDDAGDDDFAPTKKAKAAAARKAKAAAKKATPARPRVRATPVKASANGGAASRAPASRAARPKAPPRARARTLGNKDELPINNDVELFNAIKDPNTALQSTAEDWIVAFQDEQGKPLAELINAVIRACGCNGSVDENQVLDIDNIVDTLEELQEAFKRQPIPSYPIVSKSKTFKSFRRSLHEFLQRIISSAYEAEVLTADGFMETFQAWVSAMSSSSLRSFRHTATVIALWTISAINEVSAQATKDLATATRQRDAEKKKARADKSRLQELERKVQDARRLKASLDEYINEFISTVFVNRYRDFDAGIRSECVQELGAWMKRHPNQYLQGTYFSYIGRVLSDADSSVRMAAIRALTGLYSHDNFVGSIRHFTEMFKDRLVQMATLDVYLSVRIATISVLVIVDKHNILEQEQRYALATHIFDF